MTLPPQLISLTEYIEKHKLTQVIFQEYDEIDMQFFYNHPEQDPSPVRVTNHSLYVTDLFMASHTKKLGKQEMRPEALKELPEKIRQFLPSHYENQDYLLSDLDLGLHLKQYPYIYPYTDRTAKVSTIFWLGYPGNPNKYILDPDAPIITLTDVLESTDILLDFSTPHATLDALEKNLPHKTPIVIGTTGFTGEQRAQIKEYSQEFPILQDSNFSIGMNILFHMTKEISAQTAAHNFMTDIHETHHKHKKDAPSGTALKLARLAKDFPDGTPKIYQEQIARGEAEFPRTADSIGISFQRRGEVIGEHQISFTSDTETLELSHKALTREVFAEGAVQAALWLLKSGHKSGIYEMADVLGFSIKS